MKNIIIKSVGVTLVIFTLISTLTGCYLNEEYYRGDSYLTLEFSKEYNARVESDKSIFDKGDVELTLSYGLYLLHDADTIEKEKISHYYNEDGVIIEDNFAIYISNSEDLIFEYDDNRRIIDHENKVNAKLLKFISFEEAFTIDHGYTISAFKINYHHSEKITIPAEFFDAKSGKVFVHLVCLRHYINDQNFQLGYGETMIEMEYRLICDKIVLQ